MSRSSSAATVGVMLNPAAAGGRRRRLGVAIFTGLEARGLAVVDVSADTPDAALGRARQEAATGLDALVVAGGDGTVHVGVNVVAGTSLPLGIVACGSGNDVARAVGLPVHDIDGALDAVAAGLAHRPRVVDAVDVDIVDVGAPAHPAPRSYLGVLSAGIDAAVNARANRMTWPPGGARYVLALAAELPGLRPYGYRVQVDGQAWVFGGTMVAVANGPAFGGGMRIAPEARLDDGLLDVVLVGPVRRLELARVFPLVYLGRHVSHPAVTVLRGREVVIEPHLAGGHAAPPHAYADGEPIGPLPVRCTVRPDAVRLLAPVPPVEARAGASAGSPT